MILLFCSNELLSFPLMTYKQALAKAFSEAMEYATDDQVGSSQVDAFVKLHLEDFQEMILDYVAERI